MPGPCAETPPPFLACNNKTLVYFKHDALESTQSKKHYSKIEIFRTLKILFTELEERDGGFTCSRTDTFTLHFLPLGNYGMSKHDKNIPHSYQNQAALHFVHSAI